MTIDLNAHTPAPELKADMRGVCYRETLTDADYDEAIADLQNAKAQRQAIARGEYQPGCAICGDSGHTGGTCHHHPLILARKWTTAKSIFNCYHCGFVTTTDEQAREHFGTCEAETAKCIKEKAIESLSARVAEQQASIHDLEAQVSAVEEDRNRFLCERDRLAAENAGLRAKTLEEAAKVLDRMEAHSISIETGVGYAYYPLAAKAIRALATSKAEGRE